MSKVTPIVKAIFFQFCHVTVPRIPRNLPVSKTILGNHLTELSGPHAFNVPIVRLVSNQVCDHNKGTK